MWVIKCTHLREQTIRGINRENGTSCFEENLREKMRAQCEAKHLRERNMQECWMVTFLVLFLFFLICLFLFMFVFYRVYVWAWKWNIFLPLHPCRQVCPRAECIHRPRDVWAPMWPPRADPATPAPAAALFASKACAHKHEKSQSEHVALNLRGKCSNDNLRSVFVHMWSWKKTEQLYLHTRMRTRMHTKTQSQTHVICL